LHFCPQLAYNAQRIAEVAAFQHFINACDDRKNTLFFITRVKAAILAIRPLYAGVKYGKTIIFNDLHC